MKKTKKSAKKLINQDRPPLVDWSAEFNLYHFLENQGKISLWSYEPATSTLIFSENAKNLLKLPESLTIVKLTLEQFCSNFAVNHPDLLNRPFEELVEKNKNFDFNLPITNLIDRKCWLRWKSFSSIKDKKYWGLIQDITSEMDAIDHQNLASEELKRQNAFLEAILPSLPLGIICIDSKKTNWVVYTNLAFCQIFEVQEEEILAQEYCDILPPSIIESVDKIYKNSNALKKTQCTNEEVLLDIPGRPIKYLKIFTVPVLNHLNEDIDLNLILFEDITDSVEKSSHLESFSQMGGMAGIEIDLRDNKISYAQGIEQIENCGNIDLYQYLLHWKKNVHQDSLPMLKNEIKQIYKKQKESIDVRLSVKDGHSNWIPILLKAKVTAHDHNKNPTKLFMSIIDITQLDKLEKELQANQMHAIHASKLAALGEMAASVGHELKNPLAVLDGYSVKLTRLAAKNLLSIENATELAGMIKSMVNRMTAIINSMARISRDPGHSEHFFTSLQTMLDETLMLCQEKFKLANIELSHNLRHPTEISCSPTEFSQVLLNLLNNAYDAIKGTDQPWVKIDINESKDTFSLSVINSGPPIPKHIREKLFTPFYTTKDPGKGTGLGLSISRQIIQKHEGELALLADAEYTCFSITLPSKRVKITKLNAA